MSHGDIFARQGIVDGFIRRGTLLLKRNFNKLLRQIEDIRFDIVQSPELQARVYLFYSRTAQGYNQALEVYSQYVALTSERGWAQVYQQTSAPKPRLQVPVHIHKGKAAAEDLKIYNLRCRGCYGCSVDRIFRPASIPWCF